jgi:hypothetical protein
VWGPLVKSIKKFLKLLFWVTSPQFVLKHSEKCCQRKFKFRVSGKHQYDQIHSKPSYMSGKMRTFCLQEKRLHLHTQNSVKTFDQKPCRYSVVVSVSSFGTEDNEFESPLRCLYICIALLLFVTLCAVVLRLVTMNDKNIFQENFLCTYKKIGHRKQRRFRLSVQILSRVTGWVCEKIAQNVAQTIFRHNQNKTFSVERCTQKCVLLLQSSKITDQSKNWPLMQKFAQSGRPALAYNWSSTETSQGCHIVLGTIYPKRGNL